MDALYVDLEATSHDHFPKQGADLLLGTVISTWAGHQTSSHTWLSCDTHSGRVPASSLGSAKGSTPLQSQGTCTRARVESDVLVGSRCAASVQQRLGEAHKKQSK
jgi:hypothetical protein